MGNCSSNNSYTLDLYIHDLAQAIKSESIKRVKYLLFLHFKDKKPLTSLVIPLDSNKTLSLSAYSLFCGRTDTLKLLHSTQNLNFIEMEKSLHSINTCSLNIICEHNYIELFEYYSEIYMRIRPLLDYPQNGLTAPGFRSTDSKSMSMFIEDLPKCELSPIQIACVMGNISIIKSLISFSTNLTEVPDEINVGYIEKGYGLNCALIACQTVNYNMIRFLNNCCKANFHLVTQDNQNCLQLLLTGAKTRDCSDLYSCFTYLIERVKVDVKHNYEEVLKLSDRFKTADYYLLKLEEAGVGVDKEEMKRKYGLFKQDTFRSFSEKGFDGIE